MGLNNGFCVRNVSWDVFDYFDYLCRFGITRRKDIGEMITKEQALINAKRRVLDENYDLKAQCEGYRNIVKQQADRIAELEKQLQTKDAIDSTMPYIESWNKLFQQQGTPQLQQATPQTNAEPVAWIANDAKLPLMEDGSYWLYPTETIMGNDDYIPLYTTPQTKPLSDEEILEIANPMFYDVRYPSTALDFAKAIEERHGIK